MNYIICAPQAEHSVPQPPHADSEEGHHPTFYFDHDIMAIFSVGDNLDERLAVILSQDYTDREAAVQGAQVLSDPRIDILPRHVFSSTRR